MGETKSEDWLPPDWTMKERVRYNGKKDKIYYAPSNGPAFNSRAEVSHYLSAKQTGDYKAKKKNQGTLKPSAGVVLVEKGDAEGLPPGWIKEVRLRKSAGAIRRDPFYYDPVSKNVFRSLKAVNRYLKTEELGTLAQNSEGSSHKDSEDNSTFSTKVIKKQQLGVSRTRRRINFDRSSDMNDIVQDEQVHNLSSQPSPLSEHTSELREGSTELRNSDLQEAEDLDQGGEKGDASKHKFDEVVPPKQPCGSGKAKPDLCKSKKKTVPDLPRRASKRLAGLEVDPIPELKPRTRTRRVSIEELGKGVASTSEGSSHGSSAQGAMQQPDQFETDSKSSEFSQQSNSSKNFSDKLVTSEKQVGKAEAVFNFDEKQRSPVYPLESQLSPNDKAEEKLEAPLDLPLGELLTDPCIAFAIKTLTGVSFYKSDSSEVLPGPISSEHSPANLAMDIFGKVETQSKIGEQDSSCAVSLEEDVRNIENDTKADEKSGSPIEFPFGGAWQDPCIEFAIKTLTDAIPVDYDPSIQQYFQQQLSSPKTQESDEMRFTSVGLDNLFQTDSSCQQFSYIEKPGFQQELQVPRGGNVSLQNPDGSALYKRGKERH